MRRFTLAGILRDVGELMRYKCSASDGVSREAGMKGVRECQWTVGRRQEIGDRRRETVDSAPRRTLTLETLGRDEATRSRDAPTFRHLSKAVPPRGCRGMERHECGSDEAPGGLEDDVRLGGAVYFAISLRCGDPRPGL